MAAEQQREYGTYTSDDGVDYTVMLAHDILNITELGFTAFDAAHPDMPKGYRMRHADFLCVADGRRRSYPVGGVAADVWTASDKVIAVKDKGNATPINWALVCLIGERRKVRRELHPS